MSTPTGADPTSDDSSSDVEPIEWLATGREKRSNAGNRLQAMLSMEETQDEAAGADEEEEQVNALFLEDEDEPDEEFEAKQEADEDEEGDSSSSSSEDEAAQDELEGEKQLRKEERERQKAQKRKTDKTFAKPRPPAKRVRISEPTLKRERESDDARQPDRKRKKSERVSWTLDEGDARVRASSRTLAVQNKERTRESLKESEAKRIKQMAVMEAARERRQAEEKGPMSQEDRLREAAEVERLNARSLSRWEELEAERVKRQKQKLEALQSRKIEGPLIRWWSGPAVWVGDKLTQVGRPKPVEEEISYDATADVEPKKPPPSANVAMSDAPSSEMPPPTTPFASSAAHTTQTPNSTTTSFLDGIEQFASMQDTAGQPSSAVASTPQQLPPAPAGNSAQTVTPPLPWQPPANLQAPSSTPPSLPYQPIGQPTPTTSQPSLPYQPAGQQTSTAPQPSLPYQPARQPPSGPQPGPFQPTYQAPPPLHMPPHLMLPQTPLQQFMAGANRPTLPPYPALPPAPPPPPTTALRSMLTFENFDPIIKRSTEAQRRVVFRLKKHEEGTTSKPPLPELCAVTAQKAKYRDPLTGMPYRGMAEFKRLRNLPGVKHTNSEEERKKKARWSSVLEAWVGTGEGAVGVPEGFVTSVAPPLPVEKPAGVKEAKEEVDVKPEGGAVAAV